MKEYFEWKSCKRSFHLAALSSIHRLQGSPFGITKTPETSLCYTQVFDVLFTTRYIRHMTLEFESQTLQKGAQRTPYGPVLNSGLNLLAFNLLAFQVREFC